MLRMLALSFLVTVLISHSTFGQDWKAYPYHEDGTELFFPLDEGRHPGTPIEWWYINAKVIGEDTGNSYSFMLTYFYYPVFTFDGFRIFNVANETTGVFHGETLPCTYPVLSDTSLHIEASPVGGSPESWVTLTESDGTLRPFQYRVQAQSAQGAVDLELDTEKRPLLVGGTGYLDQGADDFTYYYSQTGVAVSGTFTFEGISEPVTGKAWIDRQYGDFNPNVDEKYEWFSLQLTNGMDINLWNIFTDDNRIPDTSTYRILSAYVDDSTAITTSDFNLERLGYVWMPDGQVNYARRWKLTAEEPALNLVITTVHDDHEVFLPFRFYEGTTIILGTVDGVPIIGQGFAELLHAYQDPEVVLTFPFEGAPWDLSQPVTWQLQNPDDGRPVLYDLEVSYDNQENYVPIAQNLADTAFLWDAAGFPADSLYFLRLTAHSVDSILVGATETATPVELVSGVREAGALSAAVQLFPNPSRGAVFLTWSGPVGEVEEWFLYDVSGRLLRRRPARAINSLSLDLTGYPPGPYLLELVTEQGVRIPKRLTLH